MKPNYTINFTNDYKDALLKFFEQENYDLSDINTQDIFKLSLEFHAYQKKLLTMDKLGEDISQDAKYSSEMMFKWLNHLEEQIEDSIEEIIELAQQNNITVNTFPLHIQLQLDITTRSFEIYETQNNFNINLEL
jgi:hypothetical protein